MSNCVYSLFGRHFGSEFDLDNFLFTYRNSLNLDNISDIVFSQSPAQTNAVNSLFNAQREAVQRLQQNGQLGNVVNEIKQRKRNGDHITPEEQALADNFYGVNYALGQLDNQYKQESDGRRPKLTTEFDEKNYALKLFEEWHDPNAEPDQKGIQGKILEVLNKISGTAYEAGYMPDANIPENIRNNVNLPIQQRYPKSWDIFQRYIKQYWLGLGAAGSAVHYVAEQFWKNNGNVNVTQVYNDLLNEVPQLRGVQAFNESVVGNILTTMAQLKAMLIKLHTINGVEPQFFPEFVITGDLIEGAMPGKPGAKLMGIIDLLVVDANGVPHIYDYKTSDKEPSKWVQAKEDAFQSQTGAYREMLRAWKFDVENTRIGIVPLLMEGFQLDESLKPFFRGIVWDGYQENSPTRSIMYQHGSVKLNPDKEFVRSMKYYLATENSARKWTSQETNDFINKFSYYLKAMFPNYNFQEELTEASIKDIVRYARHDRNTGKWYLPTPNPNDWQYFDSKEDITENAILDYHKKTIKHNRDTLSGMKTAIRDAVNDGNTDMLPETHHALNGQNDRDWFLNNFKRYCNGEWEYIECEPLNEANIIILKNKELGYYDFIGLSAISLDTPLEFSPGNHTVFGSFEGDITSQYYGVDALESNVGNVELMKTCLAINLAAQSLLFKSEKIGNIRVINPHLQQGRMPTSKQTLDNFNQLCNLLNEHEEVGNKLENNFANYKIEVLDASSKARLTIMELANKMETKRYKAIASKYEKTGAQIRMTLDELNQVRKELEAADNNLARGKINTAEPQGLMYYTVMQAIAEINGAFYTQELRNGKKALMNISNPEVMDSPNIRKLHTVVNNANMQFTTKLNEYTAEWRKRFKKFKKDMGLNDAFNQGRRYMFDSDYYLFQNMWEYNKELGIFKFKDPLDSTNDLKAPERELLKWYLEAQWELRFKGTQNYTEENHANMRADRNSSYYDVPLLKAENQEKIVNGKTKGMVNWFKRTMQWFTHFNSKASEMMQKAHNEDDLKLQTANAENYKMIDRFEYSETGNRMRLIRENDEYYFSHSLDRIFYNYAAVKLRKEVMDEYLPVMKAVLISLKSQELLDGLKLGSLTEYVGDYIQAKVLDQSLISEDYRGISQVAGNLKMATTIGALGFNPKSGLFQVFEGVFKNFSRSYFKPMGENQFGIKEYLSAMRELFGDTPNHFKTVSMGQLLNEQYSINDQDVNQKADRLREGQNSLTFMGKAMWLVSAPDFLNRMAIFIAQMKKDGCYEAHELDQKNMTIKYDFKKDGRFKVFNNPNADKNSLQYRKQRALYERMIQQFNQEGYTTIDQRTGEVRRLEIGDDLPQAYTNKEARSIKSFADQLYGYYNHEDKMLLNSYLLGSMYTQFRTYWSSLRNRWWLKGQVYNQGHWEQMKTRDGELVYKKVITTEDGEQRVELVWGDNADPNTMDPAMDWKGHYQEGYLQSFISLCKSTILNFDSDKGFIERFKDWRSGNGDESVGTMRRSNMSLMIHDLGVYALISWLAGILLGLLKEQKKEDKYKNLSTLDKMERDFAKTFALSMASSVEDLGAFKDLTSPITDWTPPSLKFATNIYKDTKAWMSGDKDFSKVMSENIGLIRQTENVLFL